jgi:hypothetical protein
MSVFTLLSYINKVSIIAFFITTVVVGYQIYILRKEKSKEHAPSIPDFKEGGNLTGVSNFTNLPSSMLKKDAEAVNYSKVIFPVISVLTVIVIVFVVTLIGQKGTSNNQAPINPPLTPTQVRRITPTPRFFSTPTPISTLSAGLLSPTLEASPSPIVEPTLEASPSPSLDGTTVEATDTGAIVEALPTISPTEIILAVAPSVTSGAGAGQSSPTVSVPKVLPETGSIQKGLMIIGVAVSTIFFSFWF